MLKLPEFLSARQINRHKSTILFLFLAIFLGFYVRLANVLPLSYPINDGGLFYTMTVNLQDNHYILPQTTSYNAAGIPFAYPPLAFYIAGLLSNIFGWNLLDIFRILPAIISMLALPGLYLLTKDLLASEAQAAIACLIFVLTPGSFEWLVMGGGITRGLGLAFALITLHYAYLLYNEKKARYIIVTAIFAAGTVLSHPEMALHTVASALVMFLFWGRSKKGLGLSILTAGLTLVLTAPWWLSLLLNHGLGPVLAAGKTGWHSLDSVSTLLIFNFTSETYLTIIGVMGLLGMFVSLRQKNYFFISWLLFIYVSEPRSAPLYAIPLICMLAATFVHQILFPGLQPERPRPIENANWADVMLASGTAKLAFAFLLGYFLLGALNTSWKLGHSMNIQKNEAEALAWINKNTPANSKFVIITDEQPMTDTLSEWFPTLTTRISLATVQGFEWMPNSMLTTKMNQYGQAQHCLVEDETCLFDWAKQTGQPFDYVILRQDAENARIFPLRASLNQSSAMKNVFELPGIVIFRIEKP